MTIASVEGSRPKSNPGFPGTASVSSRRAGIPWESSPIDQGGERFGARRQADEPPLQCQSVASQQGSEMSLA